MVNTWGSAPVTEALLGRLQAFLPRPKKGDALEDYLGVGYPLFLNKTGKDFGGLNQLTMPVLITKDRVLVEAYVRQLCPVGKETSSLAPFQSGDLCIPDDLHLRVWTAQPNPKSNPPDHAQPETVQAFQDAGFRHVEFMQTVKSPVNSVVYRPMKVNVSHLFYDDWAAAVRSGEPYICFLPRKKYANIIPGLCWFTSMFGISADGDNRKITEKEMQDSLQSGKDVPPEVVWLWRVQEWALAEVSTRQGGFLGANDWGNLHTALESQLKGAVQQIKLEEKPRSELVYIVGTHLLQMVRNRQPHDVLAAVSAMQEDTDLSWWCSAMQDMDVGMRKKGMDVHF